jgi:hypothetical protein
MSTLRGRIGSWLGDKLGLPTAADYTEKLINTGECKLAVDIGCGVSSLLTRFRPGVKTVGIDAHTVEVARARGVHDYYVVADIIKLSAAEILDRVNEVAGTRQIDLITFYGVIEHLPKHEGWKLLEKCEQLTNKYILLETPTGFVPQGPEYGNEFQKHLSGWYPDELRGLGYDVYGTTGTRYLRGYMGEPRIKFPGARTVDSLFLARVLFAKQFPQHAFNFVAIKDRRGVPARYESYDDPNRQ